MRLYAISFTVSVSKQNNNNNKPMQIPCIRHYRLIQIDETMKAERKENSEIEKKKIK